MNSRISSGISAACILVLFAIMLLFPKPVFEGASAGLLLWFSTVLPTLLPFIIIANLMMRTNALALISKAASPLLSRTLFVSGYGSFAVLCGFLCGYPMGAKTTADLISSGHISVKEGRYLLSFCNNTSPMFIISYIIWQNMKNETLLLPSLFILFAAPLCCSFFFRRWYFTSLPCQDPNTDRTPRSVTGFNKAGAFRFEVLDSCLMDGFEAIVKVGGYIMLFSILIQLAYQLPLNYPAFTCGFLPMLEITNGIPMILNNCTDSRLAYILVLSLTSFGGFCAAAQTSCMVQGTGLKIFPYIIQKLITAAVTSLFACIYLFLRSC